MTELVVSGPPIPWQRAKRQGTRYFTHPDVDAAKTAIAWEILAKRIRPTDARVAVTLEFHLPPDTGRSKKAALADIDNCTKLVLDACNGKAYNDDRQVDELHVTMHRNSTTPRTVIRIDELPPTHSIE